MVCYQLLCVVIDDVHIQCRHLNELFHDLILILLTWNRLIGEIVITQFITILTVLYLVTIDVISFQLRQVFSLHTGKLSSSKAVLTYALSLTIDGSQCFYSLTFLSCCIHREGIFSLREQVCTIIS